MFLFLLVTMLMGVAGYQIHFVSRRRRLAARSWDEVLGRVEQVNFEGLRSIADCYLQPDKDQLRIEPDAIWEMAGGLEGIGRLKANAAVMLELAVFAERWNGEQGPVISEMIRRDAVRLNRAVTRIQLVYFFRLGFVRVPFYLQEASAAYYLMRGRLLGLYHNSHIGLLPRLEAAI